MTGKFSLIRLIAVAAALALGTAVTQAAETWRLASVVPADSPEGKGHQRFADKVGELTGGNVKVHVFPAEQLGRADAILEQLKAGTIQVWAEGLNTLEKFVPDIKWIYAEFLFNDFSHWQRFMRTDLVKGWIKQAEEKVGVTVVGDPTAMVRGPYRVMVSKKPVNSLADVRGLKLRVVPNPISVETWKFLGADTRPLGWTEVYESMGRGVVEAVGSPISLVESMKFYEVASHIAVTREYPQTLAYMVNAKAYSVLSPDLRQAVNRAQIDAAAHANQLLNEIVDKSIARMKEKGATYREIDTSEFVKKMVEFYDQKKKAGELPAGFLEAVAATR